MDAFRFSNTSSFNFCDRNETVSCNNTFNFKRMPEDDSYELPIAFLVSILCLYGMGIIVSVMGNVAVLFTIITGKRLKTVTNFFLASLAASDILVAFACIPFTILTNILFHYWIFGNLMCPLVQYCQLVCVLQRAWTMTAVACDRHFVICWPLRKRLTKLKAKILIGLLWISAMIVALPTAIHSEVVNESLKPGSKGLCIEVWSHHISKYVYSIALMLMQYVIPLLIMTVTYFRIGMKIWRKQIPGEPDAKRDKRVSSSKRKSVKMLVYLVITYAFGWLPLHVLTILGDIDSSLYDSIDVHIMWIFFHFMAVSNSGINPMIYFYMKKSFRLGFTGLFRKVFRNMKMERYSSTFKDSFSSIKTETSVKTNTVKMKLIRRTNKEFR